VSILGTRVLRTEDPRFLTTGGVYTDDLRLPGACYVHFVRSAVAHARIAGVDVSAALQAPGVIAAFTGADLDLDEVAPPMPGMINAQMGQRLLARDVVRFVGEPVAVVVTERRYQGEDAADLVDVDYDLLPPVVEVDTETGKVVLRRVVAVDDAGTVLNPLLAEGQRHGGIAQGAAQAFLEEVIYDADGNPLTATFAGYPFLSATEVPSFELAEMQTPTSYNPLGAKGIGEAGTIGSTPAVQNAIIDALAPLGVRHIDMPASPQRVWQALRAAAAPRAAAAGGRRAGPAAFLNRARRI
jgi:CO/xanthine dehydrogenase Mo-binding subunit